MFPEKVHLQNYLFKRLFQMNLRVQVMFVRISKLQSFLSCARYWTLFPHSSNPIYHLAIRIVSFVDWLASLKILQLVWLGFESSAYSWSISLLEFSRSTHFKLAWGDLLNVILNSYSKTKIVCLFFKKKKTQYKRTLADLVNTVD